MLRSNVSALKQNVEVRLGTQSRRIQQCTILTSVLQGHHYFSQRYSNLVKFGLLVEVNEISSLYNFHVDLHR
jgi:hypothetical protein